MPYSWPLPGPARVTTEFGARDAMHNDRNHPNGHGGMDLAAPPGTAVLAAQAGVVVHAGTAQGYGHWVVIRHADGYQTIYGHLSSRGLPAVGAAVDSGQAIGLVGTAAEGHSSGPHLHFQVNRPGTGTSSGGAVNPRPLLTMPGGPAR